VTKCTVAIAPVYGFTTRDKGLACMNCGRGITIKYRKSAWPLVWWYSHIGFPTKRFDDGKWPTP
jgi:hypothetical protein